MITVQEGRPKPTGTHSVPIRGACRSLPPSASAPESGMVQTRERLPVMTPNADWNGHKFGIGREGGGLGC